MISSILDVLQQGPDICRGFLPASRHFDLHSALVCGTALKPGFEKQIFLDSGLIHLMVVSGAHLLFIEALLARAPSWIRLPVLGIYCWLTGFGPPVVKAFTHRVLEVFLKPRHWKPLQVEAVAVLLLLVLRPMWLVSRSFQMSWMCSMAMNLPRLWKSSAFDQSVKSYLMLFIFTGASVLSILWNTLLAPFVGMILFPVCLLGIVFPFSISAVDLLWDLFLGILSWGPKAGPFEWFLWSSDLVWIPPLIHYLLLRYEVRWRRAYAFS